jgi:PTS system mannose-specific IIB component/fructoselysine and glucoselysine-specific PTS system IIB component
MMSVVLFRVDERLIHGQVVVGWGSHLRADRIVVVDDELATSQWEQELYQLGLPPETESEFTTIAAAREALPQWRQNSQRLIVLTRDVTTMLHLAQDGLLHDADINIGGIHHAAGRRRVLPYIYLSAHEESALRQLAESVGQVSARDLPSARSVDVDHLLHEAHG